MHNSFRLRLLLRFAPLLLAAAALFLTPGLLSAQTRGASQAPSAQIQIVPMPRANPVVASPENIAVTTGLRWAELVALLLLIGAVMFRLFMLHDTELPDAIAVDAAARTQRFTLGALLLFFVATITRAVAHASPVAPVIGSRFHVVLSVIKVTPWGHAWMIGLVGAAVIFVGLVATRGSFTGWVAAGLGATAIATSEALTGHAAATAVRMPLAVAIDVGHVLGAGGWIGGLAIVLVCGLPALRPLEERDRARTAPKMVRAYHHAAADCITVVIVTALVAAWLRVGTFSALWTTAYGRVLVRKTVFVIVLLALTLFHWRMAAAPEWSAEAKFRFQRSAAFELVVGAIVVGVTALLINANLPVR